MTKIIAACFTCALLAGACSKSAPATTPEEPKEEPKDTTTTADPKTDGTTPCAQELALECPDGQIDVCLQGTPADGETHRCVAKEGT